MSLTIQLAPEAETKLRERAARAGQAAETTAASLLEEALERTAAAQDTPALRTARPYDAAALVAALNSFVAGDEAEQRTTLANLKADLDRDRPGQRSIFGEGINPPVDPRLDEAA